MFEVSFKYSDAGGEGDWLKEKTSDWNCATPGVLLRSEFYVVV